MVARIVIAPDRPLCQCHGETMSRNGHFPDGRSKWMCAVKSRARNARRSDDAYRAARAAYSRRWHAENRERLTALMREYARTHRAEARERDRRWQERNPERVRELQQRRYSIRKGAGGDLTGDQWSAVCIEFGNRCVYCGSRTVTVDHVVPLSAGGEHTRSNVLPCCVPCNTGKLNRTMEHWVRVMLPRLFRGPTPWES